MVADVNRAAAEAVAAETGGLPWEVDVSQDGSVAAMAAERCGSGGGSTSS
jgi:hypothetical protein